MNESRMRPPGMACPQCRQPILVEPLQLLSGSPIQCGACGLELHVNREGSAEALAALQAYMDDLEKVKNDYSEQATEMLGRGRPKSRRGRARSSRSADDSRRRNKRMP